MHFFDFNQGLGKLKYAILQIKPNFSEDQLHLICGDVGPFEAGMPVCVPLWMAVNLRKRHRCEIIVSSIAESFFM